MRFTLFGRQPAVWMAIITAVLTLASTFNPWFFGFDALVQALLLALWAAFTTWKVRPFTPAVISAVIVAVADLLARFGFDANAMQLSAIDALAVLIFTGIIIWPNVTPVDAPAPGFYPGLPVADLPAENAQGRVSRTKIGGKA